MTKRYHLPMTEKLIANELQVIQDLTLKLLAFSKLLSNSTAPPLRNKQQLGGKIFRENIINNITADQEINLCDP